MKERKWLATHSPHAMLGFLQYTASRRKTRLFACAAVRSLWHLLPILRSLRAVEVAERYADGLATPVELREAERAAVDAYENDGRHNEFGSAAIGAASTAHFQEYEAATSAILAVERCDSARSLNKTRRRLSDLLREVFGNPFRPVTLDPAWRSANDSLAQRLARELYDDRRFNELPVLADALEDAGCDNRELLDHLRRPDGHVRGCWALDAVLALK